MLNLNFDPFPELKTKRLTLRRLSSADVDEIFAIRSDKNTMYFIPRPLAQSNQDVVDLLKQWEKSFMDKESINWAITLSGENKLIGMIGFVRMTKDHLRAEIGYVLSPACHGKGIMSEAAAAVIDFGFSEMKLYSIEAVVDPENKPSVSLLERSRFVKEAHFKKRDFYHGKFNDTAVYTLHSANTH